MVRWKLLQRNYYLKKFLDQLINSPIINNNPIYNYFHFVRAQKRAIEYEKCGPELLYIETHNYCNSKCIMCGYPTMKREKGFMSNSLFEKIIREAAQLRVKKVFLHGTSEPLMDKKLLDKVNFIKNHKLYLHIVSNGSLLNENLAQKLILAAVDEITISFDGFTKATYESIRIGLNFDAVKKNLDRLIALKKELNSPTPRLRLNFVNSLNKKKEAYEFWTYWRNQVEEVICENAQNWAGQVAVESPNSFVKSYPEKTPCRFLWIAMFVLWNGTVPLCCNDYEGKVVLGDINQSSIKDVWNGEPLHTIRQKHFSGERKKVSLCSNCYSPSVWW